MESVARKQPEIVEEVEKDIAAAEREEALKYSIPEEKFPDYLTFSELESLYKKMPEVLWPQQIIRYERILELEKRLSELRSENRYAYREGREAASRASDQIGGAERALMRERIEISADIGYKIEDIWYTREKAIENIREKRTKGKRHADIQRTLESISKYDESNHVSETASKVLTSGEF